MIRAVSTKRDGGKILVLGVDDENVKRLTSGKPIFVEGEPLGLPVDVVILHGRTLQDVLNELKDSGIELPVDRVPIATPGHPVVMRNDPSGPRKEPGQS